jgi:hypothetical protein
MNEAAVQEGESTGADVAGRDDEGHGGGVPRLLHENHDFVEPVAVAGVAAQGRGVGRGPVELVENTVDLLGGQTDGPHGLILDVGGCAHPESCTSIIGKAHSALRSSPSPVNARQARRQCG